MKLITHTQNDIGLVNRLYAISCYLSSRSFFFVFFFWVLIVVVVLSFPKYYLRSTVSLLRIRKSMRDEWGWMCFSFSSTKTFGLVSHACECDEITAHSVSISREVDACVCAYWGLNSLNEIIQWKYRKIDARRERNRTTPARITIRWEMHENGDEAYDCINRNIVSKRSECVSVCSVCGCGGLGDVLPQTLGIHPRRQRSRVSLFYDIISVCLFIYSILMWCDAIRFEGANSGIFGQQALASARHTQSIREPLIRGECVRHN